MRHSPHTAGYNMSLWTTKLVRHCIYTRKTRFGIEYCRERVLQVLHALGFWGAAQGRRAKERNALRASAVALS
ncbi:MAG TPA: hypothetical protein VIH59_06545 [Candidatus Tectomicrobia bacterium]